MTSDIAATAARYDGATLRAAESARDQAQQQRVAQLRQRFVDGPVLTMPAGGSGTSDTRGSVGIRGVGTVLFNHFTLSAQWDASMQTAASCVPPMEGRCPYRYQGRSKEPRFGGTDGAPL